MFEKDLLSYFPGTPRPTQIQALNEIESAIKNGVKFIIIQAPTGCGKSHISATLANASKSVPTRYIQLVEENKILDRDISFNDLENMSSFGSMTLTVTKLLQNQYENLFNDSCILKGRRNYQCNVDASCDAEIAPCMFSPKILGQCIRTKNCSFFNARNDALKSKFPVLNYSMFMCLPDFIKKRQILICDEATEIEDELVGHFSAEIEYDKLRSYNIVVDPLVDDKEAGNWLYKLYITTSTEYSKLITMASVQPNKFRKKMSHKDANRIKYLKSIVEQLDKLHKNWDVIQFVIEKDDDGVTFVPLHVDKLANSLFNSGDIVILMSATIIDHKTFAKSLGIETYKYIEVESTFDPKKSPIYCPGTHKLNYSNLNEVMPKVIDQIIDLCTKYNDKKGIIHTHTNKITGFIQDRLRSDKRFLFRQDGSVNERIIHEHSIRTDATVLVSPSMEFGTSLDDDLSRFQIIVKLPYPTLGSKRIKTLFEMNKQWYIMKTLIALVQMAGRSTRNENDYCDTYILDGNVVHLIKQNWQNLPSYFKNRLI